MREKVPCGAYELGRRAINDGRGVDVVISQMTGRELVERLVPLHGR